MKQKINFIVDALMFLLLAAISGLGFLMKYVLIPGQDREARFGNFVDLYFLGWDRHQWGTIHLILGVIMLVFLLIHIVLHWRLVKCLFRKLIQSGVWRNMLAVIFCVICLFLLAFPFLVNIEVREAIPGEGHHVHDYGHTGPPEKPVPYSNDGRDHRAEKDGSRHRNDPHRNDIRVYGSMTLRQVSEQYGVPVDTIVNGLHIQGPVSRDDRLEILKKRYGFRIRDVRNLVWRITEDSREGHAQTQK